MKKVALILTTLFAVALMANDGAGLYKKCAGCHGMKAEKKALGKSHVIAKMSEKEIVSALKGYKAGTYGRAMKGLMKGQIATYSDEDIGKVAKYITTLSAK